MFNPFKRKTKFEKAQDKVDQQRAENIRHQAELEERLKLAKEHGVVDAEKKYGKFKEPKTQGGKLKKIQNMAKGFEEGSKRAKKMMDNLEKM